MKSTFFALALLCSFQLAHAQVQQAQTQPPPTGVSANEEVDPYSSNSEKFADSSDRLIQREYIRSGHVLGCVIQVIRFTDVVNGTRRNALRFIDTLNGKQAYLDEDEVGALYTSMYTIRDKILQTKPDNYTEVRYKSRSGFVAASYYNNKQWLFYLRLKQHDDSSAVYLKKFDFDVFLQILDNVKGKFQQQ